MTTNKKALLAIVIFVIIFFVFLGKVSNPNVFQARITSILDEEHLIVQPINGFDEQEIFIRITDESQVCEWSIGEVISIKYGDIGESSPLTITAKEIKKAK